MNSYNNRLINPDLYKRLEHRYQPYLPHQKVVYLDHFVFRKMYNAVNSKNEEVESFWVPLFNTLTDLRQKRKIFCPRSYLHEEETLLAVHDRYSLKKFSESVSGDMVLEYPEFILLQQMILSLKSYIAGKIEENLIYSPGNVLIDKELEPWRWLPYFDKPNPNEGFVGHLQTARDYNSSFIDQALTLGRDHPEKSFREHTIFFYELKLANIIIDFYNFFLGKFQLPEPIPLEIKKFYNGDLSKKEMKESGSMFLIRVIADFFIENDKRNDISLEESLTSFLESDQAKNIPCFAIMSHLVAAISIRAKNGQKSFKNHKSMVTDFEAISYYMPYCDVMFLDNECANLLNEKNLKEHCKSYNTEIFSTSTKENLMNYLKGLY